MGAETISFPPEDSGPKSLPNDQSYSFSSLDVRNRFISTRMEQLGRLKQLLTRFSGEQNGQIHIPLPSGSALALEKKAVKKIIFSVREDLRHSGISPETLQNL